MQPEDADTPQGASILFPNHDEFFLYLDPDFFREVYLPGGPGLRSQGMTNSWTQSKSPRPQGARAKCVEGSART